LALLQVEALGTQLVIILIVTRQRIAGVLALAVVMFDVGGLVV
jgi:hypothetical protein